MSIAHDFMFATVARGLTADSIRSKVVAQVASSLVWLRLDHHTCPTTRRASVITTLFLDCSVAEITGQNKVSGVAILVSGSSVPVCVVVRSPLIADGTLTYPFRSHSKA